MPSFTSQPSVAHHDRDVPAEQGRCAPSQRSRGEDLAACMLLASTHRPRCPGVGSLQHCQHIPPPCSRWGRGLTELLHPHPTQPQPGPSPPTFMRGWWPGQTALPAARSRMVPCKAGHALGSPTSMPPPSTLTVSCGSSTAWHCASLLQRQQDREEFGAQHLLLRCLTSNRTWAGWLPLAQPDHTCVCSAA